MFLFILNYYIIKLASNHATFQNSKQLNQVMVDHGPPPKVIT